MSGETHGRKLKQPSGPTSARTRIVTSTHETVNGFDVSNHTWRFFRSFACVPVVHVCAAGVSDDLEGTVQTESGVRREATRERLFQNLRASRKTELANEYPLHVVTAWLGNTERVASQHYLQVTDSHFEQAQRAKIGATTCHNVSKPAPQESAAIRTDSQEVKQPSGVTTQVPILPMVGDLAEVPPRGVEQSHDSSGTRHGEGEGGTECGTPNAHSALIDTDLRSIIDVWPELNEFTKARILAIIDADRSA